MCAHCDITTLYCGVAYCIAPHIHKKNFQKQITYIRALRFGAQVPQKRRLRKRGRRHLLSRRGVVSPHSNHTKNKTKLQLGKQNTRYREALEINLGDQNRSAEASLLAFGENPTYPYRRAREDSLLSRSFVNSGGGKGKGREEERKKGRKENRKRGRKKGRKGKRKNGR